MPATAFLRYALRADGLGVGRQAVFLAHLADHGVVADDARRAALKDTKDTEKVKRAVSFVSLGLRLCGRLPRR